MFVSKARVKMRALFVHKLLRMRNTYKLDSQCSCNKRDRTKWELMPSWRDPEWDVEVGAHLFSFHFLLHTSDLHRGRVDRDFQPSLATSAGTKGCLYRAPPTQKAQLLTLYHCSTPVIVWYVIGISQLKKTLFFHLCQQKFETWGIWFNFLFIFLTNRPLLLLLRLFLLMRPR